MGEVCYYFWGEWTAEEKELINKSKEDENGVKMAINYLEMAAILILLDAAEVHFQEKRITLFCDNEGCCKLLRSYKARKGEMPSLVEGIDLNLTRNNIDFDIEWIATKNNIGSDALSRNAFEEFRDFISEEYGIIQFKQVYPKLGVRDIGNFVRNATSLHA